MGAPGNHRRFFGVISGEIVLRNFYRLALGEVTDVFSLQGIGIEHQFIGFFLMLVPHVHNHLLQIEATIYYLPISDETIPIASTTTPILGIGKVCPVVLYRHTVGKTSECKYIALLKHILKYIAVDPTYQGEGLTATLVTALKESALKAGDENLQNHIRDITANINSCL